jgi:hypothetical protein
VSFCNELGLGASNTNKEIRTSNKKYKSYMVSRMKNKKNNLP